MAKWQESHTCFTTFYHDIQGWGESLTELYQQTGGKVGGDIVGNIAGNITDSIVEKISTTRAKIVRIIWKNPNATALSISKEIDIASRNVQEHQRKLQEQGGNRRMGPDKGALGNNRTIVFEGKKTPRRQIELTRINEERIIAMNMISFFAGCGGLETWDLSKQGSGWFRLMSSNQVFTRPMSLNRTLGRKRYLFYYFLLPFVFIRHLVLVFSPE